MNSNDEESELWDLGGKFPTARQRAEIERDPGGFIRRIVNTAVREAVIEYISAGRVGIDYRLGGSPVVQFRPADPLDVTTGCQTDLGDLLLRELAEEWRDQKGHPIHDLLSALLETYEQWRAKRVASDPNCDIPEPSILTDE